MRLFRFVLIAALLFIVTACDMFGSGGGTPTGPSSPTPDVIITPAPDGGPQYPTIPSPQPIRLKDSNGNDTAITVVINKFLPGPGAKAFHTNGLSCNSSGTFCPQWEILACADPGHTQQGLQTGLFPVGNPTDWSNAGAPSYGPAGSGCQPTTKIWTPGSWTWNYPTANDCCKWLVFSDTEVIGPESPLYDGTLREITGTTAVFVNINF